MSVCSGDGDGIDATLSLGGAQENSEHNHGMRRNFCTVFNNEGMA